jgi:hypothetical protein
MTMPLVYAAALLPAHAGVILSRAPITTSMNSAPRARGGDPAFMPPEILAEACSPRTRG